MYILGTLGAALWIVTELAVPVPAQQWTADDEVSLAETPRRSYICQMSKDKKKSETGDETGPR